MSNVDYLTTTEFSQAGFALPQSRAEKSQTEISNTQLFRLFWQSYLGGTNWGRIMEQQQSKAAEKIYVPKPIKSGEIFNQATYRSINQNHDVAHKVDVADQQRRNMVQELLSDVNHILVASGSHLKIEEVATFVAKITGAADPIATSIHPLKVEPSSPNVVDVAGHKAAFAHDFVTQRLPPDFKKMVDMTGTWLNWQRLLERKPVINSLEVGKLAIGADVNFFWRDESGGWNQELKLDRLGRPLTLAEEVLLYHQLEQIYCFSPNKQIEVTWPIAAVWINCEHNEAFWNMLRIISQPLDPELFRAAWESAKIDGKIYATNPHFGLLEALKAQDQIVSIGTLSNEERDLGLTIDHKMMAPTTNLIERVSAGVISNSLIRGV